MSAWNNEYSAYARGDDYSGYSTNYSGYGAYRAGYGAGYGAWDTHGRYSGYDAQPSWNQSYGGYGSPYGYGAGYGYNGGYHYWGGPYRSASSSYRSQGPY